MDYSQGPCPLSRHHKWSGKPGSKARTRQHAVNCMYNCYFTTPYCCYFTTPYNVHFMEILIHDLAGFWTVSVFV